MRLVIGLIASAALLAACGGGSGSDNNTDGNGSGPGTGTEQTPNPNPNPNPNPGQGTQASLTQANYVAVAQEALSANAYLLNSVDFVMGAQVSDSQALLRVGEAQLAKARGWFARAPVATAAVHTESERCENGGTLTLSINDRNNNLELDGGDSVSIMANNCREGGDLLNGRLSITFHQVTGDPDGFPFTLSATLEYGNLSVQSAASQITGNGSVSLTYDAKSRSQQARSLTTPQFSASATHGGQSTSQTLKNYEAALKVTPNGTLSDWASSANGVLFSSSLQSKSIAIETRQPFVTLSSQRYPGKGEATITGAAGAKVRVTAVDAASVRIELDADGNGIYETSVTKPWGELL